MEKTPLLPLPEGMLIEQIQITETGLMISVISTYPTSCCPLCSQPSSSLKSHYRRTVRDVPCGGSRVLLALTVRKFYCRNAYCPRKVFAERFPAFVEPWARTSIRYCQQITAIGLSTPFTLAFGPQVCMAEVKGRDVAVWCHAEVPRWFCGRVDFPRFIPHNTQPGSGDSSTVDAPTARYFRSESGSWRGVR